MESPEFAQLRRAAEEALSVGLGFGILGFQRFQVRRREWERASGTQPTSPAACAKNMTDMLGDMATIVSSLGRR